MFLFNFLARLFERKPAPIPTSSPTSPPPPAPPVMRPIPAALLMVISVKEVICSYTAEGGGGTVKIKLTDDNKGAWVRLMLPDGSISPITRSPAGEFIGLGGNSAHEIDFSYLVGCRIQTASSPQDAGGWKTVAYTR